MTLDTEYVQRMIDRAVQYHRGQARKCSEIPYIFHPMEVAKKLSDWGVEDEEVLAAAIGHDLVKDTPDTVEAIRADFGHRVASLIEQLTWEKDEGTPRAQKVTHWYIMSNEAKIEALVIKVADRYCNVRDYTRQPPRDRENKGEYAALYALQMYPIWRTVCSQETRVVSRFSADVYRNLYDDVVWIANLIRRAPSLRVWLWDTPEVLEEALGIT